MKFQKLLKFLSAPIIFSILFFNINPNLNKVEAKTKTKSANEKDLKFYRRMGITYICSASAGGNDLDFEKSLIVASNLFSTVLQQKHGGYIKEAKKKEQKLDPKTLQNSVVFQLVGGALAYCPNLVPDKLENDFNNQLKKIQELDKK